MKRAAGILLVSINGNALFLKRSAGAPDCPGCWDFPGGGLEGDETAEQCATRETREEIGFLPEGERVFHTRTRSSALATGAVGHGTPAVLPVPSGVPAIASPDAMPPDVDFTTFLQKVGNEFTPELDGEHDGFAWAPIKSPPEPLHPGCKIALDRLAMNELGVARAIAEGRLTSPQRYENMSLWAIRISGTNVGYRTKHDEFVYRRPENYLTEDFLARCNGLPVLWYHPETVTLNSDEFAKRIVGTIFLPYIAGDEVWGVAKIFDDQANRDMDTMSTSPGVNFDNFGVNARLTLEDGSKVLVEGDPSALDHVAICELGVWDKGGEPTGIRSESRGDSNMTPEEEKKAKADADAKAKADADADDKDKDKDKDKDEKAKADADAGTQLKSLIDSVGKLADNVGAMSSRLDAFDEKEKAKADAAEKAKADAEREAGDPARMAADKAKKDADDKDAEDKAKKDADEKEAKAKADSAEIRKRIDDVANLIPKSMADADFAAVTERQAVADDVFGKFGQSAPRPLQGETAGLYDRRVTRMLKDHSPTWKVVDLTSNAFADDQAFGIVRDQVFAEAGRTAMNPTTVPGGQLRMITKRSGGHEIHEFVGDPRTWMDPMAGATRQYVNSIKTPAN